MKEYRQIVQDELGKLKKGWTIHHIDMNKKNNKLNNLALCFNNSGHRRIHNKNYQAWFLTLNETKELVNLFKRISRQYRLKKYYGDGELEYSWNSKVSRGKILFKNIK